MKKVGWLPPHSPHGLIQEHLWPSEWLILVSCMLLNCTSRKQLDKVFPTFMERYPTPESFVNANEDEIRELIKPLGFSSKRTLNLMKMTRDYICSEWSHARELHGIGEYAARAWEIFCLGKIGDECPRDGALTLYWTWYRRNFCDKA